MTMSIEKIIVVEFSQLGDQIAEILLDFELIINDLNTDSIVKQNTTLGPDYIDELAEKFDNLLLKRCKSIINKTSKLTMQAKHGSESQNIEHIDFTTKTQID